MPYYVNCFSSQKLQRIVMYFLYVLSIIKRGIVLLTSIIHKIRLSCPVGSWLRNLFTEKALVIHRFKPDLYVRKLYIQPLSLPQSYDPPLFILLVISWHLFVFSSPSYVFLNQTINFYLSVLYRILFIIFYLFFYYQVDDISYRA